MYFFRDFELGLNIDVRVSLLKIYGLSWRKSIFILSQMGIGYPFALNNLNHYQFMVIVLLLKGNVLSDVRIRRRSEISIKRLIDVYSYKGTRHIMCLPLNGQRTRTNAGTQRSKKVWTQQYKR